MAARLDHVWRGAAPGAILAGALPFRKDREDCLWLARPGMEGPAPALESGRSGGQLRIQQDAGAACFANGVRTALARMRDDPELRKVVLARTLSITSREELDHGRVIDRLAQDPMATAFRVPLPEGRALVGATPELLIQKRGDRIASLPLAGSARRFADPSEDAASCMALARSEKDRREHALVVEHVLDTLAPYCAALEAPDGTRLTSTHSMWHLGTAIRGRLRDDTIPSPVLAALLHPTPAICGLPVAVAADLIAELEPVDRGFYSGAVGWCDRSGDGAWFVAIRCAEIAGRDARLYAGAGIVPGSDPEAEMAETASKFAALLQALGLPADAAHNLTK
ncbi:isochorismate synthase [Paracoccus ravus]|uniref:isochorismate synthase n=1 Tax=Paracoccus ravus TaxID=2447760 RepID=UPI001FD6399A|nr:isochorismate synthase [Paracoccus ravus]